jgi:hypothetical protein
MWRGSSRQQAFRDEQNASAVAGSGEMTINNLRIGAAGRVEVARNEGAPVVLRRPHRRAAAEKPGTKPVPGSLLWVAVMLVGSLTCIAGPAGATTIERDTDFVALNQNPFESGPSEITPFQKPIALPTVSTDIPAVTIPSPVPPVFFQFGASVTAAMDLTFYGSLNPGRLDINYPVSTTFTIPDALQVGQTFSLGTSSAVTPGGFSQLVSTPVTLFGPDGAPHDYLTVARNSAGAPTLTTTNPGIAAAVDLDITNHNFVALQACTPVPLVPCADIVKANLPSLGQQSITLLSASTAGNVQILPGVPGVSQTLSLPQSIPFGPFSKLDISAPDLAQTGVLSGTSLVANKTSTVASLNLSIDGLISNTVLNPLLLPPLTGSIGPIDYSLLKANASLDGGVYQNLNFADQGTQITLAFDHLVRARVNGVDEGAVSMLSFTAGDDVKLSPIGFVPTLHVVPILGLANSLNSNTGITLGGTLSASALSASLAGLGSIGPVNLGNVNVTLAQISLLQNQFGVDMKSIIGAPFDINFGADLNGISLTLNQINDDGHGHVTFNFNVAMLGDPVASFDVTGRNQIIPLCPTCDINETIFLPDSEVTVTIGGQTFDLGDIFCVSGPCNAALDLSPLESLIHSADVAGFDPVFFADGAPDLQILDPVLTNDFVSHLSSDPDPGTVFVNDPALFDQLTSVPEPSSMSILLFGLVGAWVMTWPPQTRSKRRPS